MKALVLFSGGIDSTTCLGLAISKYGKENVIALSITYGQKHTKEIEAANAIVQYYGIEKIDLDLSLIFRFSDCSLLKGSDEDIPHVPVRYGKERTLKQENSLKRQTVLLFQRTFLSVTDCLFLLRQQLPCQGNAV